MKFPSLFKNNKQAKQPPLFNLPKPSKSPSSSASDDYTKIRSSERLFFEPVETSSILKESKKSDTKPPFEGNVVMVMESRDPYLDFKESMQEIIESEGIVLWKDWECLEELLGWYLSVNGKMNHGYIVEAFVDLLLGFSGDATSCYSTASSSFRQL